MANGSGLPTGLEKTIRYSTQKPNVVKHYGVDSIGRSSMIRLEDREKKKVEHLPDC